jgi:hypothetical protein
VANCFLADAGWIMIVSDQIISGLSDRTSHFLMEGKKPAELNGQEPLDEGEKYICL